jgi:hypothetical protein
VADDDPDEALSNLDQAAARVHANTEGTTPA